MYFLKYEDHVKPYSVTIAEVLPNYLCNYQFCVNNFMLFKRKMVRKRERKLLNFNVFGRESDLLVGVGVEYL